MADFYIELCATFLLLYRSKLSNAVGIYNKMNMLSAKDVMIIVRERKRWRTIYNHNLTFILIK